MRKVGTFATGCLLLALLICATGVGAAAKPVKVVFWTALSGAPGKVLEEMVSQFNASQKEVVVEASYQGDYFQAQQKMMIALAAGTPPDVVQVEQAQVRNLAAMGVVAPLSDLSIDTSDFVEALIAGCYYENQLYGIPFNRSTPLMYYNTELFGQAGLGKAPQTWDELLAFASKVTRRDASKTLVWGYEAPADFWFFEAKVWQNGGEMADDTTGELLFHNAPAVGALQFWADLIHKHKVSRVPPGEGYTSWQNAQADFLASKAAMILASTGSLTSLMQSATFPLGTAFLPRRKQFAVPTGGGNVILLARKKEIREGAAKFIRWFTAPPQAAAWSIKTGYMPASRSAIASDLMKEHYARNPNAKVAVDQLAFARTVPAISVIPKVVDAIIVALQSALVVGNDPKTALENAAAESQQAVEEFFRVR